MNDIDKSNLPVEIKNNELPKDNDKKYQSLDNDKMHTSGGFADAIFLAGIMLSGFLWGMLAMLLR